MFNLLALGEFIHDEGIDIALGAFSDLYHNVTSKHQKQMEMTMITKGLKTEIIEEKIKNNQLEKKVKLVNWTEQEEVEFCYQNASILILPSNENLSKLVSESFSFGLPVISYENEHFADIVDQTCGMLINEESTGENMLAFSRLLRILYFDPEARKILKRGAMNKYEQAFSWGINEKNSSKKLATI